MDLSWKNRETYRTSRRNTENMLEKQGEYGTSVGKWGEILKIYWNNKENTDKIYWKIRETMGEIQKRHGEHMELYE